MDQERLFGGREHFVESHFSFFGQKSKEISWDTFRRELKVAGNGECWVVGLIFLLAQS